MKHHLVLIRIDSSGTAVDEGLRTALSLTLSEDRVTLAFVATGLGRANLPRLTESQRRHLEALKEAGGELACHANGECDELSAIDPAQVADLVGRADTVMVI